MYLMNVPPVAARHTEWRTCGPHKGYSLPNFFNDSDTELSTRDAPISDKVQMIIESLRSSQSSLEMGDEIEGNALSGQEGHPQIRKVAVSSYLGAKCKTESPTANEQASVSSPVDNKSSDSDSDDSVDRGIEEAILEYLKEKDDHKRKAEPCFTFLQSSKISRKTPPIPEVSKHNPDSKALLIASNQFTEIVEVETRTAPAVVPIKKHIKNKESLNDNTVKTLDPNKNTAAKSLVLAKEQTKSFGIINKIKCPVKVEEDSNDSSSDDGIEEAIQRYQLEKKEQQNKREIINLNSLKEESDSTSDDGIEEAIRCYQLEQLKEKSVLKPLLHKQKPFNRSLMHTVGNTSMENTKKHKLKKKRTRTEKEVKSLPPPPSIFTPKVTLSDSSNGKGNGLHLFKVESFKEQSQPTPPPPKVNTTAELMCAEAILDISKTVMPGVFHHSVGLSSCAPTESSMQCSLPSNCSVEESEGSSIDSEDGIEQEIRRFLEQKAQMHNQPSSSATNQEPPSINEADKVKSKQVAIQKNPSKLSLTQRRKQREEKCSIPSMSLTDTCVKDTTPKPDHEKESDPPAFTHRNQTHPAAGLDKTEQCGDKSSSLDSDEDLDTAIKDLLKTKKKSKKKIRDLKRKSRKHLKDEEQMLGNSLQTKKFKPDPIPKRSTLKKVQKSKDDPKEMSGLSKINVSQYKKVIKSEGHDMCEAERKKLKATEGQDALLLHKTQDKEDSSSVDSDDSIEQEIRRFLAEKAKVSTAEKARDEDISRNGTTVLCTPLQNEYVKQENQLAEIPRKSIGSLSGQSPLKSQTFSTPQSLPPVTSTVCAQSPMTSVQSSSPSVLEPADGAGAARTQQRRSSTGKGGIQDVTPQMETVRPVLSPNASHSLSESIKWRQSLGLPITDTRTLRRSPFHITSSKIRETASATPKVQSGVITPKSQTPFTVWSATKTSRATLPCSAKTTVNTAFISPVTNLRSSARQLPMMSFTQSLAPGIRSQRPIEGERESMVHVPKDKSVFVELESNRTNHVQVQSSDRSKGKDRVDLLSDRKREGEIDEKEVHLERTDGEFIDEAQYESGSRRNPEKQQGLSTLSLSSAIDPGITFRPCIALTTEERSKMCSRRYLASHCKKALPSLGSVPVQYRTVQHVKRKLQFIPVARKNEAPSHHNNKIT